MLFAFLFNGQDELVAAAPAVFQYAMGDAFWSDAYMGEVSGLRLVVTEDGSSSVALSASGFQTAYVEVSDDELIDKLNQLETSDEHLHYCRQRVNELTSATSSPIKRPRAA